MGYQHNNKDPNLNNIHHAMEYRDGVPHLRVNIGSDTVTINGDINVDNVTVDNTASQPVPVYFPNNPTVNQGTGGASAWKVDIGTSGTVNLSSTTLSALENINATVSGTVELGSTTLNALETITVNQGSIPWQISKNSSINSNTNPIYVKGTSDTSFFSPMQSDAFGRLRVSNPFTLSDHFNRYQDNGGSFNYTAGTGSSGYDPNNASITLNVGTNSGDSVFRETSRVYAYQPGKSLLILQTFTFAQWKNNLTQRAGYFDNDNGFYLEQEGSNISFVKRSSVSGAIVETRISQTGGIYGAGDTGWNVNNLPSLNLSKSQILWIDVEWLGVGSVRMGFVINGEFIHCHTFHHANNITGTYISTACLPVRKEIFNTGTTISSSTMQSICTSVISEGGYSITGRDQCISHILGSPVTLSNTVTDLKPIISIRLKSNRLGAIVLPTTFTVTPVQQSIYKFVVYTRAITTGGSWTSAGTNSSVEYNLNPTSISSGTISLSAFINATNQASGTSEVAQFPFQYQLERNSFTSTCYEIVIGVGASTNNTTCYGSINWTEIT